MQFVLFALVLVALAVAVTRVGGEGVRSDALRQEEHRAEAIAHERATRAIAQPGATPGGAIVVTSAAAVEPAAERLPCPMCSNPRHVQTHAVTGEGAERLRVLQLRCGTCGRRSTCWVRVERPPLPS